ncbi:MAG: DUF1343 domain-containing protein [Candidatus Krumholzibacteriales bacterium]
MPGAAAAGLLANQASVSSKLVHIRDILIGRGVDLKAIFGPQHGYRGETQANMIEWESYTDPESGIPVYSLYGETRTPSDEMLDGIELMAIDLQDVGTRCYTYTWTAVLMMKACAANSIKVLVLDRPNPIGGESVEGPAVREGYQSFVGLFPIPVRHGMTIGEILAMVNREWGIGADVEIVPCGDWQREMYYQDTGLPWVLPSPNMPGPETALTYPGTIMLEGTNISEGRGTTLPFEIIGAPFIEPRGFSGELARRCPGGAIFRPLHFEPTWDKYAGEICGGVQIHVSDRDHFRPVRTGAEIICAAASLYPGHFRFLPPPYEYETEHPPIDIISGDPRLREMVESGTGTGPLFEAWLEEEKRFRAEREKYRIY